MSNFVRLTLIGNAGTQIVVNPAHVVQAQEFFGNQEPQTTLKLVNGDTLHVKGTLEEVLGKLAQA